ncbi:hypothetical protein JS756_14860 [Streptomyces actuosus]|uniref:Lipoprotein n=1 Tax=Streptomyces actuosus TaxID=1885 RepID=A0ABS2VQI6_STRAS|nr:hypothetical protein [Streptomyces actuosus]MBN0045367.1 hypothetical protein [Streptomyces actuosus]
MKRSSGARLCATAVVGALSLALVTGCSGEKKNDDAKGSAAPASSAAGTTAPAAKALTAAELQKLLLAQGELKGYKSDPGADILPKSKAEVKTDKAACDPVAWATAALPPGDTDARAANTVTQDKAGSATGAPTDMENAFDVDLTFVGLSSYDGDGAEKAMKAVSDGLAACAGGYGLTAAGESSKVTKVTSEKGAELGDESLAFAEGVDMDGEGTAMFHTQVVRKGNTVATFYTVNFSAIGSGEGVKVPAAVVEAQVAKLK